MQEEIILTVSEFVAVFNQTVEFAMPSIAITGELANFRVSKNRWVYFDLKDDNSSVKFFGTVYHLPGPLEEGMLLKVRGQPRLHNLYGFSVNILNIQPAGEGSIRKAADLLQQKLRKEGLFDVERKRALPYPPERIGLITSSQSAAYADFMKIIDARWQGVEIELIDVQVQGEIAPAQIVSAVNQFNEMAYPPEILVLIRGGGSPEDLAAFSTEQVTRAVAASRLPTIVAIGHEVDISLAELAADQRGSTPSNAAELLVPDRKHVAAEIAASHKELNGVLSHEMEKVKLALKHRKEIMGNVLNVIIRNARNGLIGQARLIEAFNPSVILSRGYSIVRDQECNVIRDASATKVGSKISVSLYNGSLAATIDSRIDDKENK